jgi:hypothetical protein
MEILSIGSGGGAMVIEIFGIVFRFEVDRSHSREYSISQRKSGGKVGKEVDKYNY